MVGGRLVRQPATLEEAVATARSLERQGYNFSVGLGQVNRYNLARFGETLETAFDACPATCAQAAPSWLNALHVHCRAMEISNRHCAQRRLAITAVISRPASATDMCRRLSPNAGDVPAIVPDAARGRIEPIPVVPAGGGTPAPGAPRPASAPAQPRVLTGSARAAETGRQVIDPCV
ncbi:hypothetical protein ACU4HD_43715 [Cupriavidus basilensis]